MSHYDMELLFNHIRYCRSFHRVFSGENGLGDFGEFNPIFDLIAKWGVAKMPEMKNKYGNIEIEENGDQLGSLVSQKNLKIILVHMLKTEMNDEEFKVNLPGACFVINDRNSFIELVWYYFVGEEDESELCDDSPSLKTVLKMNHPQPQQLEPIIAACEKSEKILASKIPSKAERIMNNEKLFVVEKY